MQPWKRNLFVKVLLRRVREEKTSAESILEQYPALTDEEKTEILNAFYQILGDRLSNPT